MSLNFSSSPATNDLYTLGTRTWRFNGAGWAVVPPQGELGYTGSQGVVGFTGSKGESSFTWGATPPTGGHVAGSGGSGVVYVWYPDFFPQPIALTGSPTLTQSGRFRIYTFTGSGSITF